MVSGYAADVRGQVGPLVPVLVTKADIPRGKAFGPADVR